MTTSSGTFRPDPTAVPDCSQRVGQNCDKSTSASICTVNYVAQEAGKTLESSRSGKHDKNPKTSHRPNKFCELCNKHGGAPKTHNTGECNKYRPDGTPTKKSFPRSDRNYDSNKRGKSYAQLALQVKELKREAKRAYKKKSEKRKRDSSSESNSDGSWSVGSSSTGESYVCKRVKFNDHLKDYTTSCPIKTTTSSKNNSNFSLRTSFSKKNTFLKNKHVFENISKTYVNSNEKYVFENSDTFLKKKSESKKINF